MDVSLSTTAPIPRRLLLQADQDPHLSGYVQPDVDKPRVAIVYRDQVIGFFTPRQRHEYYRTGAIFIAPAYQGKGIGRQVIRLFFADKKGEALIDDDNHASAKAFMAAGFIKDQAHEEGAHWYVKELRFLEKFSG